MLRRRVIMLKWKDKLLGSGETKLRKNFWTYVVLLSSLGAMAFFGVCDPTKSRNSGSLTGPAAKVGGEAISRVDFQRAYERAYKQYQRMYQDQFDPSAMQLAKGVLEELAQSRVLYLKAIELGFKATDDEVLKLLVREDVFKGEDGKFSDEAFSNFLKSNGYTESQFLEEVRRSVTTQKLQRFVISSAYVADQELELNYKISESKVNLQFLKFDPQAVKVTVASEDISKFLAEDKNKIRVKEYFDSNQKEFNTPEKVKARHILISFNGARSASAEASKRSKGDGKKLAESVLAEVKVPGAKFEDIAKKRTDEGNGKTTGGDLGWFESAMMDPAFSKAAFALKPGEVSGVVESAFGFHVIKVEDHKPEVKVTLEQAERQIAETLLAKEQRPEIAKAQALEVARALTANQPVEPLLAKYGVSWAETGDMGLDSRYASGIGTSKDLKDTLVKLTSVGQVLPEPLEVRGIPFVIKLKSRTEADLTKLTVEKREELRDQAKYSQGSALFADFEKGFKAETEKKNSIWLNPSYLALDQRTASKDTGG